MKNKVKIDKIIRRFFLIPALAVLVCFICMGIVKMTALAAGTAGAAFNIDAQMLPSSGTTFDIRLTIENTGEDWEGTARLMLGGKYGINDCAYDTAISLPNGSTKQFVVRVPKESASSVSGDVQVTLLDGKSDVTANKEFKKLLMDVMDALTMGILSDNYSALTYLDMGGDTLYYYSDYYPIKLMELNQDNLVDSLDTLTFLVIDRYNTDVLTDDEIQDINKWVDDGGVLIIGTGSYAEDTLGGFDYLGIKLYKVYAPGEKSYFTSDYVDWTQLNMADFTYSISPNRNEDSYVSLALTSSQGDGAVGILPYSLSELGRQDASVYNSYTSQSLFVYYMLDNVSGEASDRYSDLLYSYDSDSAYTLRRILSAFGNSGNILNFGVLKFIVIVYVILVGPVFYVILRLMKKKELYWVAVPAAALVGIILVFFTGRGFEVVSTRVYSVAVYNLDERGDCKTYLHCYDANHREWSLRLAEGYEYIGPQMNSTISDGNTYSHHIRKDGNRLFFGIKPTSSFEDCYFCAGRAAGEEADGSIESVSKLDIIRNVTNNTNYDFTYFAVLKDDSVQVYKNLPAGETSSLTNSEMLFTANLSGYYSYYYDYMSKAGEHVEMKNMDDIAALGVGIGSAKQQLNADEVAIIGVVSDWDKAVDDNCSEVSYGCLYMIQ